VDDRGRFPNYPDERRQRVQGRDQTEIGQVNAGLVYGSCRGQDGVAVRATEATFRGGRRLFRRGSRSRVGGGGFRLPVLLATVAPRVRRGRCRIGRLGRGI